MTDPKTRAEAHLNSAADQLALALVLLRAGKLGEAQDASDGASDHLFHAQTDLALACEPEPAS